MPDPSCQTSSSKPSLPSYVPHIEVDDVASEDTTTTPSSAVPSPRTRKQQERNCCRSFFIFGWAVGLMFLALGAYYQIAICSRYDFSVTNVHCNTTSFRIMPVPFQGQVGLVAFKTLDTPGGPCQFPEQPLFTCVVGDDKCLATNKFNYGGSFLPWPCYYRTTDLTTPPFSFCSTPPYPEGQVPYIDVNYEPGCKLRTGFFIAGGIVTGLMIFFVYMWVTCEKYY